ncbi:MAG TPA: hypothetical protein VMZ71_16385 [Gemmataceae bacterium]|nr:hypothetical protein [Gemmataceae bacterium]
MTRRFVRKSLLAVLAVGGVAAAATAQQPGATPQVVRWPGGYMVMNGPEVVVRQAGVAGTSTTTLNGVANGFGNKVVVSNGRAGGTTIVTNSRLGFGNSIVIDDEDWLFDLPGLKCPPKPVAPVVPVAPPAAAPADPVLVPPQAVPVAPVAEQVPPVYQGKANAFWTKKEWSEPHDCNLYWDPASKSWYRYSKDDDAYRQLPAEPQK